jgi:hypothetical protein
MKLFSFGKKRKNVSRILTKKPPAALLKRCRKYRIKTTMKKGGKRVYRKVALLKKLLKKKIRKMKKARKVSKKTRKVSKKTRKVKARKVKRRMGFGADGYEFTKPANYGFDQSVQQYPGTLSQTISTITAKNNISRPEGFSFQDGQIPAYGVFRDFFGESVPTQVPPNYNFMGQPDKSLMPVGAPFQRYTSANSFGKRLRYKKSARNACSMLSKKNCKATPLCSYVKRKGCRRKPTKKSSAASYTHGDDDLGSYGDEAGISFFGKRLRRYKKSARSACSMLSKKKCMATPLCSYVKRKGCRRKTIKKSSAVSYTHGDDDLGSYGDEAGISFFGKRKIIKSYRKPVRKSYRKPYQNTSADYIKEGDDDILDMSYFDKLNSKFGSRRSRFGFL